MKLLVALSCLLAVACAKPDPLIAPLAYSNLAYSTPLAYSHAIGPVFHHAVAATPVVHHSIATPIVEKTQYHAQDTLGQASYGHSEPLQTHNAVQDASGNKVGSYSYVAPDGQVISTSYVADALGYRASSNALPVAPSALPVAPAETPEVVAARAAHFNAHAIAKSRSRRAVISYHAPVVGAVHGYSYSAPAVLSSATYGTYGAVVHTPTHGVSYVY